MSPFDRWYVTFLVAFCHSCVHVLCCFRDVFRDLARYWLKDTELSYTSCSRRSCVVKRDCVDCRTNWWMRLVGTCMTRMLLCIENQSKVSVSCCSYFISFIHRSIWSHKTCYSCVSSSGSWTLVHCCCCYSTQHLSVEADASSLGANSSNDVYDRYTVPNSWYTSAIAALVTCDRW